MADETSPDNTSADLHPDLRIDLVTYAMAKIEMALGAPSSPGD